MKAFEMNEDAQREWREWVAGRPESVKAVCQNYPPDTLYKLKETGQVGTVVGYFEDGTVRMLFTSELNPLSFTDLEVFGIDPKSLEESDWPNIPAWWTGKTESKT
jgi:hypothetical protein